MTSQNAQNSEAPDARVRDGKRGPTMCDKIVKQWGKDHAQKVPVEFNKFGQVTGPPSFQSFLGALARAHVPITVADWASVDEGVKWQIWEEVFVSKVNNIFLARIQPFFTN